MNRIHAYVAAIALLMLTGSAARAQGKNDWTTNYPKQSGVVGYIDAKGKVSLDAGWSVKGTRVTAYLWEDG